MSHLIKPLLNKTYVTAKKAKGIYIYDENDNRYLDGSSGAITCSLGHSHPIVLNEMKKQLERLQFVYRSQFTSNEAEELAQQLCTLDFSRELDEVFFVNSGTEAVETAMKIAIQYWQEQGFTKKKLFLSRWTSYHGITIGALSLSGNKPRRSRFEDLLEPYPAVEPCYCTRCPFQLEYPNCRVQCAENLRLKIEQIGAENIAAFIAEPIVGAAGTVLVPPKEYFERIRGICDEYNILFIADEVMTGLGRTGTWFALEQYGASADIVTIGKSLGAGYAPIAATLARKSIIEPVRNGSGVIMSGHTYSAHPFSCGTALAVLSVIQNENLLNNVKAQGLYIRQQLKLFKKAFPFIYDIRGEGLMIGIEFQHTEEVVQSEVITACFRKGLLVYPSFAGPQGTNSNGIIIAPPFTITKAECDELLTILEDACREVMKN